MFHVGPRKVLRWRHGPSRSRGRPALAEPLCGRWTGQGGAAAVEISTRLSKPSWQQPSATRSVAAGAGLAFPSVAGAKFETVTEVEGGSGTDFGVPSVIIDDDRRPVSSTQAARLAGLVTASWATFDAVAATAPEVLRKGPRGGGRDTSKIVAHVDEADGAYARELGIKQKPPADRAAVEAMRAAVLDILSRPSDGSPLADRKWPQRYAARRIAWHALDHAWEIEDKSP